jgi:transposase
MAIVTLGIDLAKNVFALHGVDAGGKAALVRPSVSRCRLLELVASLPPRLNWHGGPLRGAPLGA